MALSIRISAPTISSSEMRPGLLPSSPVASRTSASTCSIEQPPERISGALSFWVEDGAKLRVDTTVVQTDIHHPTDNTLLWDVVRVVTRLVRRLAKALELRRIKGFCDRTRSARRRMYEIQRMTTRQRHEQQTRTYRVLIDIAEEVVRNARAGIGRTL